VTRPYTTETILAIHRWTPELLSFQTSRPADFRFIAGQYVRLGLAGNGDVVWRPYSMVSASDAPTLEFYATLVRGGAFSEALATASEGTPIDVDAASLGFLTLEAFHGGDDLWLIASGTGLGPFVAILREDTAWRQFSRIVLVHSVRRANELAYRDTFVALAAGPPGGNAGGKRASFRYLPAVTRETLPGAFGERITTLLADGRLEAHAGTTIDAERSRIMVCGNPELAKALRALLTARGLAVGRRGIPGQLAFENYW